MRITSGLFKNRRLAAPKGADTRPTSERLREALCNICQGCMEGARFLDLFAGSGAMGLEALSRGALSCTFIDSSRDSVRSIQTNVETLQVQSQVTIHCGNVFTWLERLSRQGKLYDIIYADPPYDQELVLEGQKVSYSQHLLDFIDTHPLLDSSGSLFIEDSSDFKPDTSSLNRLQLVSSRRMGKSSLHEFSGLNFIEKEDERNI